MLGEINCRSFIFFVVLNHTKQFHFIVMKKHSLLYSILLFLPVYFLQTLTCTAFAQGHHYYVNVKGSDDNDGSLQHPWRTIHNLNTVQLQPGDHIHVQENVSFAGILYLRNVHGKKDSPIVIKCNKNKPVIINANDSSAIVLDDCSFVTISNVSAVGSGRKNGNTKDGIAINRSDNIKIDNVAVSGFQKAGLLIYNSTNVTAKHVSAHENGFAGIYVSGEYGDKLHCKNIRIIGCDAYNNPGNPTMLTNHSGNGILVGFCTQVLIDSCTAFNNGWDMPRKGNGPVGIWCYEADSVVIQHCISYENKTSKGGEDGGGYDFDGGTTNSVIQYCLSYRNEGSAFGIFQYDGASPWHDNVIRYCISEDDGNTSAAHANAYVWNSSHDSSQLKNLLFYNNTLYNSKNAAVAYSPESEHSNFCFYNNIFVAKDALLRGDYSKDNFLSNDWWSSNHQFKIDSCFDFSEWAHQHNKELWNGKLKGINIEPSFIKAGNTKVTDVRKLSSFTNYQLKASSPVALAGIDLQHLFRVDVSKFDFNGISTKSNFVGACSR